MKQENEKKANPRKVVYILLSILVAAVMWLYVDLENGNKVEVRVYDVPVIYQNEAILEERGLMLLDERVEAINLTFEATRLNVGLLDKSKIRVIADLSDITSTGQQTVVPRVSLPSKPDGYQFSSTEMTLKDSNTYTLSVSVGNLFSKEVDIRCKLVGSVPAGYSAEEPILHPDVLEIRGQKEDIDRVAYAQVTLQVDDAVQTIRQSLAVQYYDRSGQLISGKGIHGDYEQVDVTLPVNVTKDLELKMNFLEAPGARVRNITYTITPAKISVMGNAEQLASINSLTLDNFDLLTLRDGIATYIYTIPVPGGCENLSGISRATLHITFKDMQTEVLPAGRIIYENYPDGKNIEILTEEVNVTLFGTSTDLSRISSSDIVVTADLTDFGEAAGNYTVPAEVEVHGSGDIGVSGTYQVRVNIQEISTEEEVPDDTSSNG